MISYVELFSWRNLCEYLDSRYYKFAGVGEIKRDCKCCLPNLYNPKTKEHRQYLFDNYLIQFVTWQDHPILAFKDNRRTYRKYGDCWGWRLTKHWEDKIDYLEQLVLFGREPVIKSWEFDLRKRMNDRERRRKAIEQKQMLMGMEESDRKVVCAKLGICWRCLSPIAFLMIDCTNCGAINS